MKKKKFREKYKDYGWVVAEEEDGKIHARPLDKNGNVMDTPIVEIIKPKKNRKKSDK